MHSENDILAALKSVKYPGYSRDIVSFGLVKGVSSEKGAVAVLLQLTSGNPEASRQIQADAERTLKSLPGVTSVQVQVQMQPSAGPPGASAQQPWANQNRMPGVGRVIAVASGKGGVGKSTVSVNLACALQTLGARVGLLDCDIYGPSIPLMMGVKERPGISAEEKLVPPISHGVRLMSMGFLLDDDQPVIWRGPMIVKTIQQFIGAVEWGELDFLLVDLPPGTGDAQLTLCQTVPLGVVRKGIAMFQKVNVPILGIVENMSYFTTPNGERVEIFGHGGGKQEAARQGISFLGEVPIFTEIREGGDRGVPVTVSSKESVAAQAFISVARQLDERLGRGT
jgi:ATP-binding protein involved in chromosome partitioning